MTTTATSAPMVEIRKNSYAVIDPGQTTRVEELLKQQLGKIAVLATHSEATIALKVLADQGQIALVDVLGGIAAPAGTKRALQEKRWPADVTEQELALVWTQGWMNARNLSWLEPPTSTEKLTSVGIPSGKWPDAQYLIAKRGVDKRLAEFVSGNHSLNDEQLTALRQASDEALSIGREAVDSSLDKMFGEQPGTKAPLPAVTGGAGGETSGGGAVTLRGGTSDGSGGRIFVNGVEQTEDTHDIASFKRAVIGGLKLAIRFVQSL